MAMYRVVCIGCAHEFYALETDCRKIDLLFCPLCKSGVEVEDIKKPVVKNWGKCHKGKVKCANCRCK